MRFLEALNPSPLNEWGGYSGRGDHGGRASDFGRRYYNWFGENLERYGEDPILRQHLAEWIVGTFQMRHGDNFIEKVATMGFSRGGGKPKFQQRHYWFIADALKLIHDRYMWKYAYNFFTSYCTSDGFKDDVFSKAATPSRFLDD